MTKEEMLETLTKELFELGKSVHGATDRIVASNEKVAASNLAIAQAIKDFGLREAAEKTGDDGDTTSNFQIFLGHVNRTE